MSTAKLTPIALLSALPLMACDRMSYYRGCSFSSDAADVFQPCIETEVRDMAGRYAMELVFEPCGSNNFLDFRWAQDGLQLYYELPNRALILNADTGQVHSIGAYVPHGPGAWLNANTLVLPIPPEGYDGGEEDLPPLSRIAIFSQEAELQQVHSVEIGYPRDLQPWGDGETILLTGIAADGYRYPYRFDPETGDLTWTLQRLGPVDNISWAGPEGLVAYYNGTETIVEDASSGDEVARYADVTRGIVHPDSAYVALETLGPPTSLYFQRTWNELSDEAQRREEARREQFVEDLPEGTETEVQPPEIHFLHVESGHRYRSTAWQGDHFQWYEFQDYWVSFILWGIENKQFQRNVAALDVLPRFLGLKDTGVTRGMELFSE
jgi:hypothetical protein